MHFLNDHRQSLFRYEIIKDINMTEAGEPYQVDRAWKERLFTRPWKPLQKTKSITPQVPSRECRMMGNIIYMHPEMARALEHTTKA